MTLTLNTHDAEFWPLSVAVHVTIVVVAVLNVEPDACEQDTLLIPDPSDAVYE